MLNKKTIIGIGVGTAITVTGIYALVTSFGLQTVNVDDTFQVEEPSLIHFQLQKVLSNILTSQLIPLKFF